MVECLVGHGKARGPPYLAWLCHQAYYEARNYLHAESKYVTASQLLSSEEPA